MLGSKGWKVGFLGEWLTPTFYWFEYWRSYPIYYKTKRFHKREVYKPLWFLCTYVWLILPKLSDIIYMIYMTHELKMNSHPNARQTLAWGLIGRFRITKDKHVAPMGPNQNWWGPVWGENASFLRMCFSERKPNPVVKIYVSSSFWVK